MYDVFDDEESRNNGIDLDNSKCKNYTENKVIENPEYLHVCLPGELVKFTDIVIEWINKFNECIRARFFAFPIPYRRGAVPTQPKSRTAAGWDSMRTLE